MYSIGVQIASLKMPFKQALPRIAEMGAAAVEIDARGELKPSQLSQTGMRQLRKMLEDHNLKVSAVRFRTRRGYDQEADLQRRIDATKEALRFAYQLGCHVVVNQVGPIDPEAKESPGWNRLCESLIDIGQFSQRAGAWLAMETGTESGEDMAALIDALPEGHVLVDLNPGNLIINGFSATEATQVLSRHIAHIHANDAVRDLARGRGLEVQLGRGSVDYPAILGIIGELNYHGYLTVTREGAADPVGEVALAVEYLKNIG